VTAAEEVGDHGREERTDGAVGEAEARSDSVPRATRPAMAAMPSALTSVAASIGSTPSPRARGTRCTSGLKTGIHVAVKRARRIQNARLRMACRTV
jgi:hypothetical protein